MLDYKDIINKHYVLNMSGRKIADTLGVSKTGVNDFLKAFQECDSLTFPLPEGITNYGIANLVYGKPGPGGGGRDESYVLPDFQEIHKQLVSRRHMTLIYQWNRYQKKCVERGEKFYSYRQFCERYAKWCEENEEDAHFEHVIAQSMEVDFAGDTFELRDPVSGDVLTVVVYVAVLPYSQMIYAEGMLSTKEPQWIQVNNNALAFFGGVPMIVTCDNCKQAVIVNDDWIDPCLNTDYADWAEHNRTVIAPAQVKKPKYKSSVENAVGILEKGIFHDLEEIPFFSLDQFNQELWIRLKLLNEAPLKKKEHSRKYYWEEEKEELIPLPATPYEFMERKEVKVSSDFHVRFDNAYYSVDKAYKHQKVSIRATSTIVRIFSQAGELIGEHPRAEHKGQWLTDPSHLPKDYSGYREWNAEYFIRKAMTVGPNTVQVIRTILGSRKYEVQTYRLCLGVINFASKYSKAVLEECCKQAIAVGKPNYSFIKNSISAVAEDAEVSTEEISKRNTERNQGAFIMGPDETDITKLLSKSSQLVDEAGEEGDD